MNNVRLIAIHDADEKLTQFDIELTFSLFIKLKMLFGKTNYIHIVDPKIDNVRRKKEKEQE